MSSGICDLIIERGYDLNIWAYARVDTVKDGMLDKLKRAGFNWLAFGIEAASDRVLSDVDKRYEIQQVYDTIARVKAAGINIIGNYIFGLPEDDLDSMQETLDLAMELKTEFANFYSAMAYPGSPLYRQAVANGWPLPATWSGYSQHAVDTLPCRPSTCRQARFSSSATPRFSATTRTSLSRLRRAAVRRRHGRAHPRDVLAQARAEIRRCLNARGSQRTPLRGRRRHD